MLKELLTLGEHSSDVARQFVPGEADRDVASEGALATWWQQETPGTTYWRTQIPARHLPGNSFALRYSDVKVGADDEVFLPRQEGASIWQFVGNATRALIMAHLQSQGYKVLMEVDDNYLRVPPPVPGTRREWSHSLDRTRMDHYSFQAHAKIIRWVDGVIVSTPELATYYEQATGVPVYVCPNSVDLNDWPVIEDKRSDVLSIGFAGSASHRYDGTLIERALDWAWRQDGVWLWNLGSTTMTWRYPHHSLPWTNDLAEYRRSLQCLDVGLCPLKRGDWQDCKSDVKAIEYTLAGAIPIVSKTPPYQDWFDLVPVCETEKDWLRALKWAVRAPREELREVWERCHDFVLEHKLIEQHIDKWREAVAA